MLCLLLTVSVAVRDVSSLMVEHTQRLETESRTMMGKSELEKDGITAREQKESRKLVEPKKNKSKESEWSDPEADNENRFILLPL